MQSAQVVTLKLDNRTLPRLIPIVSFTSPIPSAMGVANVDIVTAMRYLYATDWSKRRVVEATAARVGKKTCDISAKRFRARHDANPRVTQLVKHYGGVAQVVRAWDS